MKEDDRAINEILWAIARGTSVASLMRKHAFTRADLRRWQNKYGMPYIYKEPPAAKLAALGKWRRAKTRAAMWTSFRRAAQADGEVPDSSDEYDNYTIHAWARSRVLLVCEKNAVTNMLQEWKSARQPSVWFVERLALAHSFWLPSRGSVDGVFANARAMPAAWLGDLDPQAIHWYAALRAGSAEDLLRSKRERHRIAYLGFDSAWLDWIESRGRGLLPFTIDMRHADREYWELVQTLVPDARELIGKRASDFLDSGKKIEVDGLIIQHRTAFGKELARRLRASVVQSRR